MTESYIHASAMATALSSRLTIGQSPLAGLWMWWIALRNRSWLTAFLGCHPERSEGSHPRSLEHTSAREGSFTLWEINAPPGRDPKPRDDKILRPSRVQITRRSPGIAISNARSTWALFERRTFRVSSQNPESLMLDRFRSRPALPVRRFPQKHERTPDYLFA